MIPAVIGFTAILLDDEPFCIARSTRNFSVHIIFPVTSVRKTTFTISEFPSPVIARERDTVAIL